MKSESFSRTVADRLHSASIHLLRFLAQQDRLSGVGRAQLSTLSVLVFGGPQTLGRLAAIEHVKPPTITRIVAGMERAGLVKRSTDASDARIQHIRPTKKGEALMQRARARRVAALEEGLVGMKQEELAGLLRAAEVMNLVARPRQLLTLTRQPSSRPTRRG